jgi:arylsulfatase A-like enzyme
MKIDRRSFLAAGPAVALAQESRAQPNVIFILADDLGFKDLGYSGGPAATPNLDLLAREGRILPRHYTYPLCSPTRSGILTGRNPIRLGLGQTVVRPWESRGLPLDETTIADVFRAGGYRTAILGKWHLGHHSVQQTPQARGFDHFYGHVNGAIDYFTHNRDGGLDWQRNGKGLKEEGYATDLLAAEAQRWIGDANNPKPFFLYLPFNAPHAPLQAPERLLKKYANVGDERRRAYLAMVEGLDESVGKIVAHLKSASHFENTVIAFQSDNGGPRGQGADNGDLRAGKATVYEGGLRVPAFLSWPGRVKPGPAAGVSTLCDWLPTLAAAAGIQTKTRHPLDGANLWPYLASHRPLPERKDLFFAVEAAAGNTQAALIDGKLKLVRAAGRDTLFDIEADPYERNSLPAAPPTMTKRLDAWLALAPKDQLRHTSAPPPGFQAPSDWSTLAK